MFAILDILNSLVIGGFIILMSFGILDSTNKNLYSHNDDLIVQENLTNITSTLEFDLKKMGFGVPEFESAVLVADSNHLQFRGDLNLDWKADTIEYYVGPVSELAQTSNPDDRIFYRKVNGLPLSGFIVGIITDFNFDYLNQDGNLVDTSNPANLIAVKMIRVTIKVENPAAYSNDANPDKLEYRSSFWQQTRLVSRNLRR